MKFGSESFFNRLYTGFFSGDSQEIEQELYQVIRSDLERYVVERVYDVDAREDLFQDITEKVFRNIETFLRKSKDKSEKERNTWLKKIATNALNTYYTKVPLIRVPRKVVKDPTKTKQDQVQALLQPDVWDEEKGSYLNNHVDPTLPEEGHIYYVERKEELAEVLAYVLSLNSKPEKILAFLAMIIESEWFYRGNENEFMAHMEKKLQQTTLFEMRHRIEWLLQKAELPSEGFGKLDQRLKEKISEGPCGERYFETDSRQLSVWLSDLRKRLRKEREAILEQETDELEL